MSKFSGTIKLAILDGLTPKRRFDLAATKELEGKKFRLLGVASSSNPDLSRMDEITAENASSIKFHYISDTGFNVTIPIRVLLGLAITVTDTGKHQTLAERMVDVDGVERSANNDIEIPNVLTIADVVNSLQNPDEEESEENPAIYSPYQYQVFQDELDLMMTAWEKLTEDEQEKKRHPRLDIYSNRAVMARCVGTTDLVNPEAEPFKKVTIE